MESVQHRHEFVERVVQVVQHRHKGPPFVKIMATRGTASMHPHQGRAASKLVRTLVQAEIAHFLSENAGRIINESRNYFCEAFHWNRLHRKRANAFKLCDAVLDDPTVKDFPCFQNVLCCAFYVIVAQLSSGDQTHPVVIQTDTKTYLVTIRDTEASVCSNVKEKDEGTYDDTGKVSHPIVEGVISKNLLLGDGVLYWQLIRRACKFDKSPASFERSVKRGTAWWMSKATIKRERIMTGSRMALGVDSRFDGVRDEVKDLNKDLALGKRNLEIRLEDVMADIIPVASMSKCVHSKIRISFDKDEPSKGESHSEVDRDLPIVDAANLGCDNFWNSRYLFALGTNGMTGLALDTITGTVHNADLHYDLALKGYKCQLSHATCDRWKQFGKESDGTYVPDLSRYRPVTRALFIRGWLTPRETIISSKERRIQRTSHSGPVLSNQSLN